MLGRIWVLCLPILSRSLTCPCVRSQLHSSAPFSMILQGSLPLNGLLASLYMLMLFPEHMPVVWCTGCLPHLYSSLLQSLFFQAALLEGRPDQTFLFFL